ncbi:hypothetical protein K474DRAFT_1639427 [Panus rudis PR-1116 ss-1]|nr:hypothetical protein K474DRAFT_1639427 [Panus rudis PR-1116 ss-1]
MGFCRRCGDIVVGSRCKCGGTSVAPVVKWSQGDDDSKQDRWSRTYVARETPGQGDGHAPSPAPLKPSNTGGTSSRRFPRPHSNSSPARPQLNAYVSAHIASTTMPRPPSPLKHSTSASEHSNAEEGILPNLQRGTELAKVYGSVLQPRESLASYTCAICCAPFPPDATIYPDPSSISLFGLETTESGTRFLCRPCFVENGGSKGDCPACYRPVLILKAEGGFVEAAGKVWHKKCFCCDGCSKNIGDHPMVDLLGRPSCAECFDTCLKRPFKETAQSSLMIEERSNLGGTKRTHQSREASPALEELEQRLGIIRSRESSPTKIDSPGRRGVSSSPAYDPRTSPISSRIQPQTRDSSPVVGSGARSRTYSAASMGSPTPLTDNTPTRLVGRFRSPEPDSSDTDGGSPLLIRPYTRLRSPNTDSDDSPLSRRSYNRFRSPEQDEPPISNSLHKLSNDPLNSSPTAKATEDAIEEMKRRFLNQSSPSAKAGEMSPSSSTNTTPRRRRSRSRSRPRFSEASIVIPDSKNATVRTGVKSKSSSSSLKSVMRLQSTGEADASLRAHRTGESRDPIVWQKTGDTLSAIERDAVGSTPSSAPFRADQIHVSRNDTGTIDRNVRRSLTGSAPRHTMYSNVASQGLDYPHETLQDVTRIPEFVADRTGEVSYTFRRGKDDDSPGDPQKDLTLRRDRTGDAEVESLCGALPSNDPPEDLIDVSIPSSESTGSMSRIPLPMTGPASVLSRSADEMNLRSNDLISSRHQAYEQSIPPTPDLSDLSDTMSTQSSGPLTPPSVSPSSRVSQSRPEARKDISLPGHTGSNITTTIKHNRTIVGGITIPEPLPKDARCAKCHLPLFNTKHGGKFVTVPEEPTSSGIPPKTYHTTCFKCNVCAEVFEEKEGGHAVFVRGEEGACHVRCAPPEKITLRKAPAIVPSPPPPSKIPISISTSSSSPKYVSSSSRYERPPPIAQPTSTTSAFPSTRFGGSVTCPECRQAVSPMERGVVPGPHGTKWHATCLICGGKEAKGRRKEQGKPGCGKKLDSAAKTDVDGRVWCRECLLLLPMSLRQPSPVKPVAPTATGGRGTFIATQHTGTTTIARQFTGIGSDAGVLRQLTGGGLSPTRQLSSSPTKLYDGPRPGARYPRPKSVTGIRSIKGEGEGRGMFLVRQMTGSNSFSGNDYGL